MVTLEAAVCGVVQLNCLLFLSTSFLSMRVGLTCRAGLRDEMYKMLYVMYSMNK